MFICFVCHCFAVINHGLLLCGMLDENNKLMNDFSVEIDGNVAWLSITHNVVLFLFFCIGWAASPSFAFV